MATKIRTYLKSPYRIRAKVEVSFFFFNIFAPNPSIYTAYLTPLAPENTRKMASQQVFIT